MKNGTDAAVYSGGALGAGAVINGATPVVPFLEVPLWYIDIAGHHSAMTTGNLFVIVTVALGLIGSTISIAKFFITIRRDKDND